MAIELVLSQNDQPLIKLTEQTIQDIDFITAKTHKTILKTTRDIALRLQFENSTVLFRKPSSELDNNNSNTVRIDEIDSIRDLFVFAISSYAKQFAFFDGKIDLEF